MYNAPPVSYPVGRFFWVGVCLGLVTVLALGLQTGLALAWWQVGAWVAWRWALSGTLWAGTLAWAWWHWWRSPVGWLIWEPALGEGPVTEAARSTGWWWAPLFGPEGEPVFRAQPMVIAQNWMLFRLQVLVSDRSHVQWVWLAEGSAPERWLALRRAVKRHAH